MRHECRSHLTKFGNSVIQISATSVGRKISVIRMPATNVPHILRIIHFWTTSVARFTFLSLIIHFWTTSVARTHSIIQIMTTSVARLARASFIFGPQVSLKIFFWTTSVARLNCSKSRIASNQLFKSFSIIHFWTTSVARHKCRSPQVSLDFLWITSKPFRISGSSTMSYPQKLFNSLKKWTTSVG